MQNTIFFEEHRPPGILEVTQYFSERDMNKREAEHFFLFYELRHWKTKNGELLNNWKVLAGKWIAFALRIYRKKQNR